MSELLEQKIPETNPEQVAAIAAPLSDFSRVEISPTNMPAAAPLISSEALGIPNVPARIESAPVQMQGMSYSWQQQMPQGGYNAAYATWMPQSPQAPQMPVAPSTAPAEAASEIQQITSIETTTAPVVSEAAYSSMRIEPTLEEVDILRGGEARNIAAEAAAADSVAHTFLGNETRGHYQRMAPRAKGLFGRFVEAVKQSPPSQWLIEKMAYDKGKDRAEWRDKKMQFTEKWAAKRQSKVEEYREEVYGRNAMVADIEKQIALGGPGVANLQLELRKQKTELAESKAKMEQYALKVEWWEGHSREFAGDRDRVAREMISRYEQRLAPTERHIKSLEHAREGETMRMMAMEMQHQNAESAIALLEQNKMQAIEFLRARGLSEKQIMKNARVKSMGSDIDRRRAGMQTQKEALRVKMDVTDKEIRRARARANPFTVRKNEFIRMTENRPIQYSSGKIDRLASAHPGERAPESTFAQASGAQKTERAPASMEGGRELGGLLREWNIFTEAAREQGIEVAAIDARDFMETLGAPSNMELGMQQFSKLIDSFCQFRGLTRTQLVPAFESFTQYMAAREAV